MCPREAWIREEERDEPKRVLCNILRYCEDWNREDEVSRRKKQNAVQSADTLELKRVRDGLQRMASAARAKAGALAVARDELLSAPMRTMNAVAFLQGQIRALYGVASDLEDLRSGDDCPF